MSTAKRLPHSGQEETWLEREGQSFQVNMTQLLSAATLEERRGGWGHIVEADLEPVVQWPEKGLRNTAVGK